jgi:hypothetical protein
LVETGLPKRCTNIETACDETKRQKKGVAPVTDLDVCFPIIVGFARKSSPGKAENENLLDTPTRKSSLLP